MADTDRVRRRPILHVAESLGGVETYLTLFVRYFDVSRRDVILILAHPCELQRVAQARGVEVRFAPMVREIRPVRDLIATLKLLAIVRQYDAPIVHLHSSKAGVVGRLAAFLLPGTSVLYTPHAFAYLGHRGAAAWCLRQIERVMRFFTDSVIATSESEAERATVDVGFARDRVVVVPNSIECPEIGPRRVRDEPPVVLLVARLSRQKNVEMFVRVAKLVYETMPNVVFRFIGIGYYNDDEARITALLSELGATPNIEVRPWMPRELLLEELGRAAVVTLTSRFESFGYVLAEAAVRGTPTIGTRVDGIREIVIDGETGFLVDVDDDRSMAGRICQLLTDVGLYERFASRGRAHVEDRFDIQKNVERFEAFYSSLDRHERRGES